MFESSCLPTDFKGFVKTGEDEICLMTRAVDGGPLEIQFLYLPKSTSVVDFTVLPWAINGSDSWSEVRRAAAAHKRDLSIFDKPFWHVFGITSPTIQARIQAGYSKPIVNGILKCDPKTGEPGTEQYRLYLKYEPGDPDWLIDAFMNDALPYYYSRHVSESSVYWVDGRTGISTWVHPHYMKYSQMLSKARLVKPLSDPKSVACFQFRCLFDSLSPPLLSLENVLEAARIFYVSLQKEPFLTETIKAALRFLQHTLSTRTISEFAARIDRKRNHISSLPEESLTEQVCVECTTAKASLYCSNCEDYFCHSCFADIHASGARKYSHVKRIVEIQACDECEKSPAVFHCTSCLDSFCDVCFGRLHARGGRRNHIPTIMRREEEFPDSSIRIELEKAKSDWVRLEASDNGTVYVNLRTMESRRDVPLSVIND